MGGTALKASDDLSVLGMTFDSKMTFDMHLRSVPRAASLGTEYLEKVLGSIP